MKKKLLKKAKKLAARRYDIQFVPDIDTDGKPVIFARIPEMPGCVAHGETIEEAREWIEFAKIDFIYFYLEDGLMPPEPAGNDTANDSHLSVWDPSEGSIEPHTFSYSNSRFHKTEFESPVHTLKQVYA